MEEGYCHGWHVCQKCMEQFLIIAMDGMTAKNAGAIFGRNDK